MKIQTIASGSKGNCSIILCGDTNIIVDMGISYLTLKKSLEENSLSFDYVNYCTIDAITAMKRINDKKLKSIPANCSPNHCNAPAFKI